MSLVLVLVVVGLVLVLGLLVSLVLVLVVVGLVLVLACPVLVNITVRDNKQISLGDQTRCEADFYTVDHEC